MLGIIILILAFTGTISWLWAGGIDYMQKFHPDYRGEDFLNWGEEDLKKPYNCKWENVHTESNFE